MNAMHKKRLIHLTRSREIILSWLGIYGFSRLKVSLPPSIVSSTMAIGWKVEGLLIVESTLSFALSR